MSDVKRYTCVRSYYSPLLGRYGSASWQLEGERSSTHMPFEEWFGQRLPDGTVVEVAGPDVAFGDTRVSVRLAHVPDEPVRESTWRTPEEWDEQERCSAWVAAEHAAGRDHGWGWSRAYSKATGRQVPR